MKHLTAKFDGFEAFRNSSIKYDTVLSRDHVVKGSGHSRSPLYFTCVIYQRAGEPIVSQCECVRTFNHTSVCPSSHTPPNTASQRELAIALIADRLVQPRGILASLKYGTKQKKYEWS